MSPGGEDLTREGARQTLERRARLLARRQEAVRPEGELELLLFPVGSERYAVETRYVLEVSRSLQPTLLPAAAPPLRGFTAWRGELLTLLDLGILTGGAPAPRPAEPVVMVLGAERQRFGILADHVPILEPLAPDLIRPLHHGLGAGRHHLRGVTPDGALLLDAPALISTSLHTA